MPYFLIKVHLQMKKTIALVPNYDAYPPKSFYDNGGKKIKPQVAGQLSKLINDTINNISLKKKGKPPKTGNSRKISKRPCQKKV